MPDPRHVLGRAAEDAVAQWLASCGWEIVARRRRLPAGGELDLVAVDPAAVLVGIEVKARRTSRTGSAASSVDGRRIDRLRTALAAVAHASGRSYRGLRLDVVTAEPHPGHAFRWRLTRLPGVG